MSRDLSQREKSCLQVRIVRVYRNGQESRLQVRQVRMRQAGAVPEGQRRRCQEGLLPEDLSGPGPTAETTWGMPCPTCFFVPFHVHARFPLDLPRSLPYHVHRRHNRMM